MDGESGASGCRAPSSPGRDRHRVCRELRSVAIADNRRRWRQTAGKCRINGKRAFITKRRFAVCFRPYRQVLGEDPSQMRLARIEKSLPQHIQHQFHLTENDVVSRHFVAGFRVVPGTSTSATCAAVWNVSFNTQMRRFCVGATPLGVVLRVRRPTWRSSPGGGCHAPCLPPPAVFPSASAGKSLHIVYFTCDLQETRRKSWKHTQFPAPLALPPPKLCSLRLFAAAVGVGAVTPWECRRLRPSPLHVAHTTFSRQDGRH